MPYEPWELEMMRRRNGYICKINGWEPEDDEKYDPAFMQGYNEAPPALMASYSPGRRPTSYLVKRGRKEAEERMERIGAQLRYAREQDARLQRIMNKSPEDRMECPRDELKLLRKIHD